MYKNNLIFLILFMITLSNSENMPNHSHAEQLEKLLKNHKDNEFDWQEASLLFFEAYTSISRDMLQEMLDKKFAEGDQGYFEQLVMVKSYDGIKDYFKQQDRQKFDADYMRKVISSDDILQFILPYLSEVYQGLSEQGVDFGKVEDL